MLSVHGLALDIASERTLLLAVLLLKIFNVLFELAIDLTLLSDHFLDDLLVSRAANNGIESTLSVFSLLLKEQLLAGLLFEHRQNLFLELDGLLLVKLKEHVFQFLGVSIVDHTLNGSGNFFWRHLELHLTDSLLDLFHGAFVTLGLVAFRVSESLADSFLKLLLLKVSVLGQLILLLFAAGFESGSKFGVLLLGVSSQVVLHVFVNFSKLLQQVVLLIVGVSSIDRSVDAVAFSHLFLERLESAEVSQLVNLILYVVV